MHIHRQIQGKFIDLDVYQPKKQTRSPKMWLADLNLHQSDKEVLLSPTAWLTDSIINAAQRLLGKQFPHLPGLQDVSLGLTMSFNIQTGEFLQILHTSQDHWLTVSTIGVQHPKVKVFDSLYHSVPALAKAQIASLLCTEQSNIEVHIIDVQTQVHQLAIIVAIVHCIIVLTAFPLQSGTCDCGLSFCCICNCSGPWGGPRPMCF